jgi:hypothetical protein
MSEHKYIMTEDGTVRPEPDLFKWAMWFEKAKRHIGDDKIGDVRVSTVFLGVDHNFDFHGAPVLFETMIFGGIYNQEMERYCTKDEALKGHAEWVEKVKKGFS